MDNVPTTPRTELMIGDIVAIPSGKYPADEWRITEIAGDGLQLQRLYPRRSVVNQIETWLPVRRVD